MELNLNFIPGNMQIKVGRRASTETFTGTTENSCREINKYGGTDPERWDGDKFKVQFLKPNVHEIRTLHCAANPELAQNGNSDLFTHGSSFFVVIWARDNHIAVSSSRFFRDSCTISFLCVNSKENAYAIQSHFHSTPLHA